jgi:cell fate (sporulation/competence/biofilm development) regulator YmcA (YheA/YmcA/DUF963 family)
MPENPESTTTMLKNPITLPLIDQFNDSDDEFIDIVPLIAATAVQATQNTELIRPFSSSNSQLVNELLTTAHSQRC